MKTKGSMPSGLLTAAFILKRKGRPESFLPILKYAFSANPDTLIAEAGYLSGAQHKDIDFSLQCLNSLIRQPEKGDTAWPRRIQEASGHPPLSPRDVKEWSEQTEDEKNYVPTPRRICYVLHNSLPFASGGYATRAHGMATGLKANGLDVICVTRPGFPIDVPNFNTSHDIPLKASIDGVRYMYTLEPARKKLSKRDYILQATHKLTNVIQQLRPAMVIAASNHITAVPALIAARRLGIPFFYEVRGFWEVTHASRAPEYAVTAAYAHQVALENAVAQQADHVFTLTNPMKEELIARGIESEKITLAPNSCNPLRFSPRPRHTELAAKYGIPEHVPVIGYIGTFAQYEGLENLVKACALLYEQNQEQDFRILLVGSESTSDNGRGPIAQEILRVAKEHNIMDKLIIPGRISHGEVEAHYSLIDVAPFPRKSQLVTEMVSPMKPLEALAMEKAVIVSSVRALADMILDGETGLIFEKDNVQDMARVLDQLISDPKLRGRLGKAGRQWIVKERTWKKTASVVADVLLAQ